jgi:hypothetical protein
VNGRKICLTPWSTIGYLSYKRTYARRLDEADANSPTEEFNQTPSDRVVNACVALSSMWVSLKTEEKRLRSYYLTQLKGSVAGRFWWQLGTKTVDVLGCHRCKTAPSLLLIIPSVPLHGQWIC